jgi:CBS domain-containing protein
VTTLPAQMKVQELADLIAHHDPKVSAHQAWPLLSEQGELVGVITRSDLLRAIDKSGANRGDRLLDVGNAALVVAYPDEIVSDVVARMLSHGVGRLPVVARDNPRKLVGYLSRTTLLSTRLSVVHEESKREDGWIRSWKR